MSSISIIRIVRMIFTQDTLSQFDAIFKINKKAIEKQPGCLIVELVEDSKNPLVRATVSSWDKEESLNLYRKSQLFGEVCPKTKRLFSVSLEVTTNINLR